MHVVGVQVKLFPHYFFHQKERYDNGNVNVTKMGKWRQRERDNNESSRVSLERLGGKKWYIPQMFVLDRHFQKDFKFSTVCMGLSPLLTLSLQKRHRYRKNDATVTEM
jgi:hypothetical protein